MGFLLIVFAREHVLILVGGNLLAIFATIADGHGRAATQHHQLPILHHNAITG